ncbi:hypothetical protein CJF30_00010802 [Rutstroemia sp. NJR-2017a BBW]|nr:hypothetical protein CJF30_00010802 [Rutstroemia sp. NJR-2017a BBW]
MTPIPSLSKSPRNPVRRMPMWQREGNSRAYTSIL